MTTWVERTRKKVHWQKRERLLALAPATLMPAEWKSILKAHENKCHYCGEVLTQVHMEHVVPLSKGGGFTAQNIVPSCRSCNSSKRTKEWPSRVPRRECPGCHRLKAELTKLGEQVLTREEWEAAWEADKRARIDFLLGRILYKRITP